MSARGCRTFDFGAYGNRARQTKQRVTPTGALAIEETTYLGSYERVTHHHRADLAAPLLETKTVHRHTLGGVIYTRTKTASVLAIPQLGRLLAKKNQTTEECRKPDLIDLIITERRKRGLPELKNHGR